MMNMNVTKISSCIRGHHVHNMITNFGEEFSCVLEANACTGNTVSVKDNKEKYFNFWT